METKALTPDMIKLFSELAYAFNVDTQFRAMCLYMPDLVSFTIAEDKEDGEILRHVTLDENDSFETAMDEYVKCVDLLEFEPPEDYKLSSDQQHESMRRYYEKYGTKGEF